MIAAKSAKTGTDRFESLRRAQQAFDALDEGKPVPIEARLASKGGPPVRGSAKAIAEVVVAPLQSPGMVHSRSDRAPAAVTPQSQVATPGSRIQVTSESTIGSAFDRLRMGQQRLGRSTEVQGRGERTDAGGKAKALSKDTISDIQRDARLHHTLALLAVICDYYKSSKEEIALEKARLTALNMQELASATGAYEHVSAQIMILTNEAQAQQAGREFTRELRQFYDKHGTTESQIESEAPPVVESKNKRSRI